MTHTHNFDHEFLVKSWSKDGHTIVIWRCTFWWSFDHGISHILVISIVKCWSKLSHLIKSWSNLSRPKFLSPWPTCILWIVSAHSPSLPRPCPSHPSHPPRSFLTLTQPPHTCSKHPWHSASLLHPWPSHPSHPPYPSHSPNLLTLTPVILHSQYMAAETPLSEP